MWTSSLFSIGIVLLVFIQTVESVYNVYTYDDGKNDEEHCCLVRVREGFCFAKPITRSLIQVNKQCHALDGSKHRRSRGRKRFDKYLNKISRRLSVQSTYKIDDRILIELKKPLETTMIKNDLVCLASTKNNIDFNKCYLELNDNKQSRRDHKRSVDKNNEEDDEIHEENDNEIHRFELHQPLHIREDRGFFFRQTHKLDLNKHQSTSRRYRQCLSWYRKKTQKLRRNQLKSTPYCFKITDHNEQCLNQLVYKMYNDTDDHLSKSKQYTTISLPYKSKLYCQTQTGLNKFLGFHRRGSVCLQTHDQLTIEQKFTDIVGLSHGQKNQDIIEFVTNNKKFKAEFDNDCFNQTTLNEIIEPEEKH